METPRPIALSPRLEMGGMVLCPIYIQFLSELGRISTDVWHDQRYFSDNAKEVQMVRYQLTSRQKDILRTASNGLREGSVNSTWILVLNRDDLSFVKGFAKAVEIGANETDIRTLLENGFLQSRSGMGQNRTYDVIEQRIHDAVSSDFEDPRCAQQDTRMPGISIEQGPGSNLNITLNSERVTQSISVSQTLSEDVKEQLHREAETLYRELEVAQESHPLESRAIAKHVGRLVEDVIDPQPDKDDVSNSMLRLERASQAIASFVGIVTSINKIGDIVSRLPFMQ